MGDVTKNGNAIVNGSDDEPESIAILDAGAQYGKVGPVRCSLFLTNYTVNNIMLLPLSSAPQSIILCMFLILCTIVALAGVPRRLSKCVVKTVLVAMHTLHPEKLASKNLAI